MSVAAARRFLKLAFEDRDEVDAAKIDRTACFNAQQTAEKAIKAVILWYDLMEEDEYAFRTHNIRDLLEVLMDAEVKVAPTVFPSAILTRCAGRVRYGQGGPPVPRSKLPELIDPVLRWADKLVE